MGEKVTIRVEELREIYKRRAEINDLNFSDIVWTENGTPIEIDKSLADYFHFTGFGNFDFVKYFLDEPERICGVLITKNSSGNE